MARRPRKQRKPRPVSPPSFSGMTGGLGGSGLPIAGAAGFVNSFAQNFIQTTLSGQAFHWYDHVLGVSGVVNSEQQRAQVLGVSATLTGIPWQAMQASNNFLGRLNDPLNKGYTFASGNPLYSGGFQAMGMNAGLLQGGGSLAELMDLTGNMMRRLGGPDSASFMAASSGLAPALASPFLATQFMAAATGASQLGLGGVAEAFNVLGPDLAFRAIGSTRRPQADMATFQAYQRRVTNLSVQLPILAAGADIGDINTQRALLTGDRSAIGGAYDRDIAGLNTQDEVLGGAIDFYHRAAMAGSKTSQVIEANLSRTRAQGLLRRDEAILGSATRGPGAGWINTMSDLETSAMISASDPFHPGSISNTTRRGMIGQDASRLAQIAEQTRNNPAAAALMAPERSQLLLDMTQQNNAMRLGTMGSLFDVSLNAPTGFNAWGMGGSSIAAAQRHDRGISPAAGGTGASMGNGNTEIVALLRSIDQKLGAGAAGSGGTPYSLVKNRSNRKMDY